MRKGILSMSSDMSKFRWQSQNRDAVLAGEVGSFALAGEVGSILMSRCGGRLMTPRRVVD